MTANLDRRTVLKKVIKSLNDSIKTISKLERDPPITEIAFIQMNGGFDHIQDRSFEKDVMDEFSRVNNYRKVYWKLEGKIKQTFIMNLKRHGFLPGSSPEVESLKGSLPEEIIRGDDRLWIYSFDHYIRDIADKVGRSIENAPNGKQVWENVLKQNKKEIDQLLAEANRILPELYRTKARVAAMLKDPERNWKDIHVKRPKVSPIERPLKRSMIIKRPIPLPKRPKKPRKKVLKRPKHHTIGPEDR